MSRNPSELSILLPVISDTLRVIYVPGWSQQWPFFHWKRGATESDATKFCSRLEARDENAQTSPGRTRRFNFRLIHHGEKRLGLYWYGSRTMFTQRAVNGRGVPTDVGEPGPTRKVGNACRAGRQARTHARTAGQGRHGVRPRRLPHARPTALTSPSQLPKPTGCLNGSPH